MAIRLIILMSFVMIITMMLPQDWFPAGCTIKSCYYGPCHAEKFKDYFWYDYANQSTRTMIAALKIGGSTNYPFANLLVYMVGVPAFALFNGWLHRQQWFWYVIMIASVGLIFLVGQYSDPVGSMPKGGANETWYYFWFYYCTEFCMRLANVTELTYRGICFLLFVLAIPGVLFFDFVWGIWRRFLNKREEVV